MTEIRGSKNYTMEWTAIDKHVLLVRLNSENEENGVYIGAVEGKDYGKEALDVVVNGSAFWSMFAAIYFKGLGAKPFKRLFHEHPFFDEEWLNRPFDFEGRRPEWSSNILGVRPLDRHVLTVAAGHPPDTWGVYIGAVKGENFDKEAQGVVRGGSEVPFEFAELLFEDLGKSTRIGEMKWHHDPQPGPMELDSDLVARIHAGVRLQKQKGQSWPEAPEDGNTSSTI